MAAKINWTQVGQDFSQKYIHTWCRYLSPITKQREIFYIENVTPNSGAGPSVSLYSNKHGNVYLDYCTEAELDFSYPHLQNFQHKKRAMRFVRQHERQYKKGICDATAKVVFPYAHIVGNLWPDVNADTLESAFKPLITRTIDQGLDFLGQDNNVSVVLSPHLSLGHGNKPNEYWLWFHTEPVAVVEDRRVVMKVAAFRQEVQDYLRDTGDYARAVI